MEPTGKRVEIHRAGRVSAKASRLLTSILLFFASSFCHASYLKVSTGHTHYALERTKDRITFDSYGVHLDLKIKTCDENELNSFWSGVVRTVKKLPVVKGVALSRAQIVFDEEAHLPVPFLPVELRDIPKSVAMLKVEEVRKCGKH